MWTRLASYRQWKEGFGHIDMHCTHAAAHAGLSKAWGCPGLRIGWLATRDAAFLKRVLELKDYTTM